jgi:hypothetical protein
MYQNFNSGASNFFIRRDFDGKITISGNGTDVMTSYGTAPLGTWTHLRIEFNNSGPAPTRIYLNGVISESGSLNYNTTNGGRPLLIGKLGGGSSHFEGDIDEIRIWQGVQNMDRNAILTGNEAGLLAYYDATEGTPQSNLTDDPILMDKTSNGNNGTFINFNGRGLTFDGIDDRLQFPSNSAVDFGTNQNFTIEFWVNIPSGYSTSGVILEKLNTGFGYPYAIRYTGPSKKLVFLRYDGTANPSVATNSTFDDDQWHHVAFVKDGATLRIYVDGQEDATTNDTVTGQVTGNGVVYFGSRGTGEYTKGSFDELRFWNEARTSTQINDNLNNTLTGSETGLVGYYPFTKLASAPNFPGGGILDQSPTGNNGFAVGIPTYSAPDWTYGAPVSGTDSDGDGVGDRCDLCQGDDSTGDTDMDGICNDIDPDTPVTCDGSVISVDAITYSLSGDDVRASETITTNGSVVVPDGAEVTYTAGTSITLKPGFVAQGIFTARIDDCTPAVQLSEPDDTDPMAAIDWRIPAEEIGELDMMLFPNPTFGEVTTQYFLPEGGPVNLVLFDAQGRYVKTLIQNWPQDAGRHQVQWQTNRLADGMYWVQIRTTVGVLVQKLNVYKP